MDLTCEVEVTGAQTLVRRRFISDPVMVVAGRQACRWMTGWRDRVSRSGRQPRACRAQEQERDKKAAGDAL